MSGNETDLLALVARAKERARKLSWWTWPKRGQELTADERAELHDELIALASSVETLTRELAEADAVINQKCQLYDALDDAAEQKFYRDQDAALERHRARSAGKG